MKLYIKKVKNKKNEVKEWIWIEFYNQDNKRIRKTLKLLNTPSNWKKAEKIRARLLLKQEEDMFIEKKIPTLDEYKVISFESNDGTRCDNTQNDYRISYDKHISPYFGSMGLDKIKPSHIRLWQSKLLKQVSPRRVRNIRAVLSTILKDAMADEIIEKNPLSLVRTVKVPKTEITPFNMDEMKLILENSKGQDRNFFALGFFSGMRSGEMVGLKWSDIDFTNNEISISRSRKMGVDGSTKNESSNRTIDMLDSLVPFLKNQFELTGKFESYVFLNRDNNPIYDIKRIRENGWKKTLKTCEIEYRTIYQTRHSFATMMLENGEDILWISNMLGHTDSSMTLSKYTHYIKKKEKKRGEFLNKEFSSMDVISTTTKTVLSEELIA